ncbi:hypothetical protein ACFO1B_02025 [Dactylosporangium siamense]|uniref:Uncharacterized protein n=1 Tax=Dactylosporangium siamense TaxID=685454 RepID=A0A919UAE7_9ACTN|nr:hypothetical protein [Dactylosporangium siamense]GIG48444.1 hypothetical protein Dsi01nite_064850 [Dactylosporangium siamense]
MDRSTTAPTVRTQVRADGLATNHSQAVTAVRGLTQNHSQAVGSLRGLTWNHSQAVVRLV